MEDRMDTDGWAVETLESFLDRLASAQPVPGGGAAAALSGAAAAALVAMVCRVTIRHVPSDSLIVGAVERADWLRSRLASLTREDIEAYQGLLDVRRAPPDVRASSEQAALRRATVVPLDIARAAAGVLELCGSVVDIVRLSAVTDLAVAAVLSSAVVEASTLTARINLRDIADRQFAETTTQELEALTRSVAERQAVARRVNARTGLENLV
jgi:formiminotetrahydrofolate cyclodeaminase